MSLQPSTAVATSPRAEREAAARAVLADPPPLPAVLGDVRTVAGEVLHASRSRPVVAWTIAERRRDGTRRYVVVGKVYRKGGGEAAHALLRRLQDAGFDGAFAVPTPLGYVAHRKLLLQSAAPRRTLYDGLSDPVESRRDVRRTGEWLARLHAVTGTELEPLPATFEADKTAEYVAELAVARPALAGRLRRMRRRLVPVLAAQATGPLVPTHGDFQPKNVHVDESKVVVIDFDRAALAPPSRDLGHFVGQALTMAAARAGGFDDRARAWAAALFEGYLDGGGSPEAVQSTPAYVARTFLEVLFYRLVVRPGSDTSFAGPWLDECGAWLDREPLPAA